MSRNIFFLLALVWSTVFNGKRKHKIYVIPIYECSFSFKQFTSFIRCYYKKIDQMIASYIKACVYMFLVMKIILNGIFFFHQKTLPAITTFVRYASGDKSLKEVLAEKIPQEQENVKAFRKAYGSTKVGEVTVDMVSKLTSFFK